MKKNKQEILDYFCQCQCKHSNTECWYKDRCKHAEAVATIPYITQIWESKKAMLTIKGVTHEH